jgi:hypothetical protein
VPWWPSAAAVFVKYLQDGFTKYKRTPKTVQLLSTTACMRVRISAVTSNCEYAVAVNADDQYMGGFCTSATDARSSRCVSFSALLQKNKASNPSATRRCNELNACGFCETNLANLLHKNKAFHRESNASP